MNEEGGRNNSSNTVGAALAAGYLERRERRTKRGFC